MLHTGRAEKGNKKRGHLYSLYVPFQRYEVHFFNSVLTSPKKSTYIKAIYIYTCERSRYALSENGVAIT